MRFANWYTKWYNVCTFPQCWAKITHYPEREKMLIQDTSRFLTKNWKFALFASAVMPFGIVANAQEQVSESETESETTEELRQATVVVTGIRQALQSALSEKRNADSLVEVIKSEDIGKLPDQNLAEVLENVTGIQITRRAGIGSGVQIRGTDSNRVEINGVSTVGSGTGRSGISFEDLPAALIGSVEVIKAPMAKTIEGSVGGTINLRTLRPLDLNEPLASFRLQMENSDLAGETLPRFSGTGSHNWDTANGRVGLVVSGSFSSQDVASFEPRTDRDGIVLPTSTLGSRKPFPFLRIQFFDQELINYEYETVNFSATTEWEPNENLRLHFDLMFNNQERAQESARVQFSGVSDSNVVTTTENDDFEWVNLGTVDTPTGEFNLGRIQAALRGKLYPGLNTSGSLNPNLRTSSNTGARVTDSSVIAIGGNWQRDSWTVDGEFSISKSESTTPNFSTDLDFINPNAPQPVRGRSLDNGVPVEFDLRGETLSFGILAGHRTSPTTEMMLDPENYELRKLTHGKNSQDNDEQSLRVDVTYENVESVPFVTSVDGGFRWNKNSATYNSARRSTNFTSSSSRWGRPTADLFDSVIIRGPDNFNAADDRKLYVKDYLIVNGELAFDNPARIFKAFNDAITASNTANNVNIPLIEEPTTSQTAYFKVEESSFAIYGQANFDFENRFNAPIRGNAGFRWVQTDLTSSAISARTVSGTTTYVPIEKDNSYNFLLPRLNLIMELDEDLYIRSSISRDIRRPNFDDMTTSVTFESSPNAVVSAGNPELNPESVWSFDVSAEYYFNPSSLASIGFFHKTRSDLFVGSQQDPAPNFDANGNLNIDITPPCEQGGIFNPIANRNINNQISGTGICVPYRSIFNADGETTQTGFELAFAHDLTAFEDRLDWEWVSGFGFIGNFTFQRAGGDVKAYREVNGPRDIIDNILYAREITAFTGDQNCDNQPLSCPDIQDSAKLLNLSNYSFNTTLYYDKYGVNARLRYTWRSDYLNDERFFFGLPLVNDDRGQLNASVSYAINEYVTIGLEGINLTREDANQYCISDDGLLCFQGLTDRRITFGVSVRARELAERIMSATKR